MTIQSDRRTGLRRTTLIGGAAGLLVFATQLTGTPSGPPDNPTVDQLRRYYEDNLDTIGLHVTATAIGVGALLLFVVALRQLMRRAEEPNRLLTDLTTAAGVLVAAWFWLYGSAHMMPVVLADENRRLTGVDDIHLATLDQFVRLGETLGDLSAIPRGLLILGPSLLALRTRFLPRWIAYFGLLIAAASLICIIGPAWWITPFGIASLIGMFGFIIWILLTSITLLAQSPRPRVAPTPTNAP
jgi:hypothetical protein